jgi:hypothetical protein
VVVGDQLEGDLGSVTASETESESEEGHENDPDFYAYRSRDLQLDALMAHMVRTGERVRRQAVVITGFT